MNEIAMFEKVSLEQYMKDRRANGSKCTDEQLREEWLEIQLPQRSTSGSAGYDFHIPYAVTVSKDNPVVISTGIRAKIDSGWFLFIAPRSGLGFKYGLRLRNTTGIIDSDYSEAANEGHIMVSVLSDTTILLNNNDRFVQGIFMPYGMVVYDEAEKTRTGGMGSTGV